MSGVQTSRQRTLRLTHGPDYELQSSGHMVGRDLRAAREIGP